MHYLETRRCLLLALILGVAPVSGCAGETAAVAEDPGLAIPEIYAAYTLFAPAANGDNLIYARVIVDANPAPCPKLVSNTGAKISTTPRTLHPDAGNGGNNFPVTACEAIIAPDTSYTVGSIELQPVTRAPRSVLVYGDSGCEAKNCASGPSKHFLALAQVGAQKQAGLILHMGDFNYRGTSGSIDGQTYAYDAGDGGYGGPTCGLQETYYSQNAGGSPRPDAWQYWNQDFFMSAKSLLPTAPWVFARGNHELCSRAGPGWFYFLGPGSSLPGGVAQMQCPDQGVLDNPPETAQGHIDIIPPYMVKLNDLQLWVMDSANACDDRSGNALTKQYQQQFAVLHETVGDQNTWMMTHRPLWGLNTPGQTTSLNNMLQTALAATPQQALPPAVTLSLSGHMHTYQSLTFPSPRPAQIVIGNSGVSLSGGLTGDAGPLPVDGQMAQVNGLNEFGFLAIKLAGNGDWTGEMLDETGNPILECDSKNPSQSKPVCQSNTSQ